MASACRLCGDGSQPTCVTRVSGRIAHKIANNTLPSRAFTHDAKQPQPRCHNAVALISGSSHAKESKHGLTGHEKESQEDLGVCTHQSHRWRQGTRIKEPQWAGVASRAHTWGLARMAAVQSLRPQHPRKTPPTSHVRSLLCRAQR